jgi:hypothetical protein
MLRPGCDPVVARPVNEKIRLDDILCDELFMQRDFYGSERPGVGGQRIGRWSNRFALPGLRGFRPTSFLAEQGELAPEMSSGDMIAGPFPELSRLPVMAFRLVPSALRVKDSPQLMPGERFQGRLSDLLKQGQRCLIAHQRLFLPTFRQGQGTEVTLVYALAPKVA